MQDEGVKVIRKMSFNHLVSVALKGISQVIFVENVVSGLIILSAITIADYKLGIIALMSAIIGTLIGYVGGADENVVDQGLFGYNSVLIGLSLSLFLGGEVRFGIALVGAAFVAIFTAAMMHILKNTDIPVLTFPFIISTWLFLFASYNLNIFQLASGLSPQDLSQWSLHIEGDINLIKGLISGIGQVYFQSNFWVGILILIAVFWDNWKLGIYTILGTMIGWVTAWALGVESTLLNLGLYGYNSVLTMLTISPLNDDTNPFRLITGILAAMMTVPITASIDTLLMPYGIPPITMPFVLVSWIFIGAKKILPKL